MIQPFIFPFLEGGTVKTEYQVASATGTDFLDVDRSEFDCYLKGPERVSVLTTSSGYTWSPNQR